MDTVSNGHNAFHCNAITFDAMPSGVVHPTKCPDPGSLVLSYLSTKSKVVTEPVRAG